MKFNKLKVISLIVLITLCLPKGFSQENILNKKISISFSKVQIKAALESLEKQYGISFAYNDLPDLNQKITAEFRDEKISDVLTTLFKGTTLSFKVIANKITVYELKKKKTEQTIHGYIYDKKTGEALIGATLYDNKSFQGTTSNQFGFFSLTLPKGVYVISISFVGYNKQEIQFTDDLSIKVLMDAETSSLDEVVIRAQKDNDFVSISSMGITKVSAKSIKAIPSIGGESDMLKAITLLPGVQQGTNGSAGFYVRGGGPDQNLILLDGVPLYNPYHLWGFLSTFNADAIKNVEITKGAFPARYGGRLSSVLDISMNDGNNQKWEKKIALGILSGKASISGPLKKDTSSIFLSARRTFLDLFAVPINSMINSTNNSQDWVGYNFTDLNLKTNYRFSDKNRIYLSAYYSRDKFYRTKTEKENSPVKYKDKSTNNEGWMNAIASLRWNHLFHEKLFVNTTLYYTGYNYYSLNENIVTSDDPDKIPEKENLREYSSNIKDFALKQDYQYYLNNKQSIKFGLGGIYHLYEPRVNTFYTKTAAQTINNKLANANINATELFAYLEDDFEIGSAIKLNAGIHASGFLVNNTSYYSIQPRISSRFLISKTLSIKAGYSQMVQYQHLLASTSLTQSSDLWVPVTEGIKPQEAEQYALGLAWFIKNNLQLEVEGYYKTMENLISYKEGASLMETDTPWEDLVTAGKGESYGAEVLIRKNKGALTGWAAYTLSWTNRQFEEINFGQTYPYKFDRRHDISIVGNYELNEKWDLNMTWVFNTGIAISVPTVSYINPYYDGDVNTWWNFPNPNNANMDNYTTGVTNNFQTTNNYRLPNYHRLDITATWHHTTKKNKEIELTFGLTNAYNKLNPSFYVASYPYNENGRKTLMTRNLYYQVSLFPIMPTVSYSISF